MSIKDDQDQLLLQQAEEGILAYLTAQRDQGRIAGNYYEDAVSKTIPNLRKWLLAEVLDRISPNLRDGLRDAIRREQWEALTNAFSRDVSFGTGGIREKMGSRREEILRLKQEGIHASIIKGPNTINDVIYLLTSAGVAQYGLHRSPPFAKVVIGYDSRIRGADFARLIASLFLAYDYTVYLFDDACMYPSVTFAVPTLRADIGVFISASHNDFRYNGYKLSCQNGSQFDLAERDVIVQRYLSQVKFDDIVLVPLASAAEDRLWFLGGVRSPSRRDIQRGEHAGMPLADPLPGVYDLYADREHRILDIHTMHIEHVKEFILRRDLVSSVGVGVSVGFSAFNGSGRKAVPRLLAETGFKNVRRIMKLDPLDGMFPAFCSDPGKEQQPDPGDWRAADIAADAYKDEYPNEWQNVELILGTDPDADRCGVMVKVPPHQRPAHRHPGTHEERDYALLSADEMWALILWYRLQWEIERFGAVQEPEKKFIALSHTTTDLLTSLARKHGLGVLKTWVGFAQLAGGTRVIWDLRRGRETPGITDGLRLLPFHEGRRHSQDQVCNPIIHSWEAMDDPRREINVAALEQSNGFSILGGLPPDERSLGAGGHVRDKDGTFAALLVAEFMAYLKVNQSNLFEILDNDIYGDPEIGLYITYYEPDPIDGEYEGLAGYTKKRRILNLAEDLFLQANGNGFQLGKIKITHASVYRTGKYDGINWIGFPDEGYRFYLSEDGRSHLTIRPSGTSNALRFHVQHFDGHGTRTNLVDRKGELRSQAVALVAAIRELVGATSR